MNIKKGFTLIELLVVVSLISLLTLIIVLSLTSSKAKSRDAQRKDQIKQIYLALELYANDNNDNNGNIPNLGDSNCLNISTPNLDCFASSSDVNGRWSILAQQLSPYISSLGVDPCPNCGVGSLFFTKVYAQTQQNYEFIYKTPSAISDSLIKNNINPFYAGISNTSYQLYAKRLEKNGASFGFGYDYGAGTEKLPPTIIPIEEPKDPCEIPDSDECRKYAEKVYEEKDLSCQKGEAQDCA